MADSERIPREVILSQRIFGGEGSGRGGWLWGVAMRVVFLIIRGGAACAGVCMCVM